MILRARTELDMRCGLAAGMLQTFLQEELSQEHLCLIAGERSHLNRFRAFIKSFYTTKFGNYPPPLIDFRGSDTFDPGIYATMCEDFKAVYDLLVDRSIDSTTSHSLVSKSKFCVAQSVQELDERCNFIPLRHPLPQLPETFGNTTACRMFLQSLTNTVRGHKANPNLLLAAQSAMIKATNLHNPRLLNNDFVRAYRKFEEDSVIPFLNTSKAESISHARGREVRWILIYAVYQVLLSCTKPFCQVLNDTTRAHNLAVSTKLPAYWRDKFQLRSLLRKQKDFLGNHMQFQSIADWVLGLRGTLSIIVSPSIDIGPDTSYTAKLRRDDMASCRGSIYRASGALSRSQDWCLSRKKVPQQPLSMVRKSEEQCDSAPWQAAHWEIIVHGYGNGTNAVKRRTGPPNGASLRAPVTPRSSTSPKLCGLCQGVPMGGNVHAIRDSKAPPLLSESSRLNLRDRDPTPMSSAPQHGGRSRKYVSPFVETARATPTELADGLQSVAGSDSYAYDYEELVEQQEEYFYRHEIEPLPLRIRNKSGSTAFAVSPVMEHRNLQRIRGPENVESTLLL